MDQHVSKQAVKQALEKLEVELREQINFLASNRDYSAIVFGSGTTAGDQVRSGLNSRWLNVLRMLSVGNFDVNYVLRELAGDTETVRIVAQALP
jgi:hypothetical protein